MLVFNGYSLTYYKSQNKIVIGLPQTAATTTNTLENPSVRKVDVDDESLAPVLVEVLKVFYKQTEGE